MCSIAERKEMIENRDNIGDSLVSGRAFSGLKTIIENCNEAIRSGIRTHELSEGNNGVEEKEDIESMLPFGSIVRSNIKIKTSLHLLHMCLSSVCYGKYKPPNVKLNQKDENLKRNSHFVFDTLTKVETSQPALGIYLKKRKYFPGTVTLRET